MLFSLGAMKTKFFLSFSFKRIVKKQYSKSIMMILVTRSVKEFQAEKDPMVDYFLNWSYIQYHPLFLITIFYNKHRGIPCAFTFFYILSVHLLLYQLFKWLHLFPFVICHCSCHTCWFDNPFRGKAVGMSAVATFINFEIQSLFYPVLGQLEQLRIVLDFPYQWLFWSINNITPNLFICCPQNFRIMNLYVPLL